MRKKLENSLEGQDIQKSDRSGFPGGVQITDFVFGSHFQHALSRQVNHN